MAGISLTPSLRMPKRERERFAVRMYPWGPCAVYDIRLLFARVAKQPSFQATIRDRNGRQPWLGQIYRTKARPTWWHATGHGGTGKVVICRLGECVDLPTTMMLLLHEIAHACLPPTVKHARPWRDLFIKASTELCPGLDFVEPTVDGAYTDKTKYPLDQAIRNAIFHWLRDPNARASFDGCLQIVAAPRQASPSKRLTNGLTYRPQPFANTLRLRAGGAAGIDLLASIIMHATDADLIFAASTAKRRAIEVVLDVPNAEEALGDLLRILDKMVVDTMNGHSKRVFLRIRSLVSDRRNELRSAS